MDWNYNQVEFKERLSNEGDKPWPWSESLKSGQGEEPNNYALAHCRCKNAEENFDHHVTQTLCKIYSRQGFVQDSRALKELAFRAACVEYPSSMLARFRVRERNYLSVRFIFRICEVRELLAVIDSLVLRQESGRPLQLWGMWNEACFPEAFYKYSNNLFAWSEILENGLLCGGVRRKRSMIALMHFASAILLTRRRVKKHSKNIQFFLWHFLISVLKFGGARTSKPFC